MKVFGNFSGFNHDLSSECKVKWSTVSVPSCVLLKPMDMLCSVLNRAQWKLMYVTHAFASFFAALSVHQLAAQGEMLYLATRIEQGETEGGYMPFFSIWAVFMLLCFRSHWFLVNKCYHQHILLADTVHCERVTKLYVFLWTENLINHKDEEGFTPLMWAAAHGQIAVVEFLLQNVRKKSQLILNSFTL